MAGHLTITEEELNDMIEYDKKLTEEGIKICKEEGIPLELFAEANNAAVYKTAKTMAKRYGLEPKIELPD